MITIWITCYFLSSKSLGLDLEQARLLIRAKTPKDLRQQQYQFEKERIRSAQCDLEKSEGLLGLSCSNKFEGDCSSAILKETSATRLQQYVKSLSKKSTCYQEAQSKIADLIYQRDL